jgi:uncharacterized membrane protein
MIKFSLKKYILFLIIYLLIDSIWILGARNYHSKVISDVQKSPVVLNPIAGSLFYILAPFAYLLFVEPKSQNINEMFENGAKIGLLMYGTFDLTNKAIFKSYPWTYTALDMLWGTFCIGLTSAIVFKLN